jgi:hypothetical protein
MAASTGSRNSSGALRGSYSADRAADVGERVVRADVARRRVHDGLGAGGEHGVDVVGRRHTQRAFQIREFGCVPADLRGVAHQNGGEFERGVGVDRADRRAAHVARTPDHGGNHAAEDSNRSR